MNQLGNNMTQATVAKGYTSLAVSGVRIGIEGNAERLTQVEYGNAGTADE